MKTLTNIKTTYSNGKVTIVGDIVERDFRFPCQQVTVLHLSDHNPSWARQVQMSNDAFFVKRLGIGVAIPLEEFVTEVANVIEPKLCQPPTVKKTGSPLTVEFNSELDPNLQWQAADAPNSPEEQWQNIEGATSNTLTPDALPKGKYVRCVATSPAGSTSTPPTQIK